MSDLFNLLTALGVITAPDKSFVERIVRNGKATIVFWYDDTKTVVKRSNYDPDDDYAAFCAAFAIKMFGSNSAVHKIIEKTEYQGKEKPKDTGFRVGDYVRLKKGLKQGRSYGGLEFLFCHEALFAANKAIRITRADDDETCLLDNGNNPFLPSPWYSFEMLEKVYVPNVGDWIHLKQSDKYDGMTRVVSDVNLRDMTVRCEGDDEIWYDIESIEDIRR